MSSGQTLLALGSLVLLGKLALSTNAFIADVETSQLEDETVATATSIGQSTLERICIRGFDHNWPGGVDTITTVDLMPPFSLGVDAGENAVRDTTFVRKTVFYPKKTGINFLTVRGFVLRHAATNWAPPTAEQLGLIGTNWSKGWIIENNTISHSICSGIALGKHGDEYDNTSMDPAEGYVKTIERGLARGWAKDTIGHHVVRDNVISHCEQARIVGSLGPVFSVVSGNTIRDIHVRQLFSGAEMAGIKFHGAIDVEISRNHIYRTCRGLWLDWMAQGTRVLLPADVRDLA